MPLTPRQAILQFGHVLQQQLFPHLEAAAASDHSFVLAICQAA
jgi:hypothetical protein